MQRGFTLIQISILLTIASLVLVTMLPSTSSKLNRDSASTKMLNAALLSLRQYQAANGTLPCPADASRPIGASNYGVASANSGASGNCTGGTPAANYADAANHVAIGMLPVRALGLPNDAALDAYGRHITYAVDTNATACWTSSNLAGQITVTDNGATTNTITALVSHGMDGHGAWIPRTGSTGTAVRLNTGSTDADQLTNAHVDGSFSSTGTLTNFVKKSPTATFDDLVVHKSLLWTFNNLPRSIPVITAVAPPANGTYTTGQTLSFTVTYSSAVTVNTGGGTPYLSLSAITGSIGTGNLAKATYQSGSGTTALTFSYTIVGADSAPTGLTMTSSITLNGGTIQSGNACAMLGFGAPGLSGVIVGGYIYVTDYSNNRIQKFDSGGNYSAQFGTTGSGNGQLSGPAGLTVDVGGNIWVVDSGNNRVEEFSSSGTYSSKFGSGGGGGPGQFNFPLSVTINTAGTFLLVTDALNHRVQGWQSNGTYAGEIPESAQLIGIAQDSALNTYTTDNSHNWVQKYDNTNAFVMVWGGTGSGNGQLNNPQGIAIDGSNNVWVVDYGNNRVQKFTSTGTYLSQFGTSGSGNGQFNGPQGIALDSGGNVWVADSGNNRVQKFTSTGTYLSQFGTSGSGNGQFNGPVGIAFSH